MFARAFADRPLFCDLLAHTPLNLERNVSPEAVRHYKLTSLGAVDEAAALVARVLPALRMAEAREFVATLASLAGSLWQIANPAPALAELYASDPAVAEACVDLAPRLRRTAEVLLAGPKAAGGQGQAADGPSRAGARSGPPVAQPDVPPVQIAPRRTGLVGRQRVQRPARGDQRRVRADPVQGPPEARSSSAGHRAAWTGAR